MTSILEGELAATITAALIDASIPYAITVTRTIPGGGPDYDPDPPTYVDYACQGFVEDFSEFLKATTLIEAGDVKVVVLLPTIAIMPEPGDTVTVRGKVYTIINASPDPALATIELQARA